MSQGHIRDQALFSLGSRGHQSPGRGGEQAPWQQVRPVVLSCSPASQDRRGWKAGPQMRPTVAVPGKYMLSSLLRWGVREVLERDEDLGPSSWGLGRPGEQSLPNLRLHCWTWGRPPDSTCRQLQGTAVAAWAPRAWPWSQDRGKPPWLCIQDLGR